jgi:hypothetical protein
MKIRFNYFYEENEASDKLWEENQSRMLLLNPEMSEQEQLHTIQHTMTPNKDILAIRYPSTLFLKKNKWLNWIKLGKGIHYSTNSWTHKEVWIKGPIL